MTFYNISIQPFRLGDLRTQQRKVVEEGAEAFAATEDYRNKLDELKARDALIDEFNPSTDDVLYECCDTIQAACNLMYSVGASQYDVQQAMQAVHEHNKQRGRYGNGIRN